MHRRQVLAALPAIPLAGCLSRLDEPFADSDDPSPPPGVEVVGFTHPEYVRAGRPTTLGAVLRNTADDRRSGTATLELSPSGSDWRPLVERAYDLAPNEQAIVETTATTPYVGSLQVRLVPFEARTTVEATDQSLDYGAPCALPNGIELAVGAPAKVEAYEYEADGETHTTTPEEGKQWSLAPVTATNPGDRAAVAPYRTAFAVLGYDWRDAIPYRAGDAYEGGELEPGATRSGAVLFGMRHHTDDPAIRLRHPHGGGMVGATWRADRTGEEPPE